jgi:hypothetical protein
MRALPKPGVSIAFFLTPVSEYHNIYRFFKPDIPKNGSQNRPYHQKTILIAKKPFILMKGFPKPVFQYRVAEDYCLGNSKTGHSKERFSKPDISKKNHSYH